MKMKVLLIGKKEDMGLVRCALRDESAVAKTVYWDDDNGPEELRADMLSDCDWIIIAMQEEKHAEYLYELLVCLIGGDDSKIINFYAVYHAIVPPMVVDRVMKNPLISRYDGMILGISHAYCGIMPRCFDGAFCNLAVSSQDIYYNFKTLEHCFLHYPEKIADMKYLIIDMYDYTYFNFDVSMSKAITQYYNDGGFMRDAHNFSKNKNIPYRFEELQMVLQEQSLKGITREKMAAWEQIFDNVHEKTKYQEFRNPLKLYERARIVKEKDIKEHQVYTSIVKNVYQETIQENTVYFYRLLELAYRINPKMKIFAILIPKYIETEEMQKEAYAEWQTIFYDVMQEYQKQYPFVFLDWKDHEIAKERACYYDATHLNYYGAVKFSKMLNDYLWNS
ncbi:MAG: hypothetical protein NC321_00490 [Clostridium sp.]|nr:hypothetical protein [Clostridium sp.]